jgi:hypothetical protein
VTTDDRFCGECGAPLGARRADTRRLGFSFYRTWVGVFVCGGWGVVGSLLCGDES